MSTPPFLIPHALDRSAARRPEATLFRFDEQALTYGEVATRTNRLAHLLVEQGVRRGDRVGIYLHKSLESGLALYGIMKAGAAYVPIDPGLPPGRVELVLRDCAIRHVITDPLRFPQLAALAPALPGLECVIGPAGGDDLPFRVISWAEVEQLPGQRPPAVPHLMEEDLAYIMYTSGSTGAPKGIMHTHRSGLSYAEMAAAVYDVRPEDVLSNHSPLHFDMSTFDYFSGPLRGATTVIIPEAYMKFPASLSELMQDEGITIWYSVTTALVELLHRGDLENRRLEALRWVNFGGEPFPPRYLHDLMALLPQARFSNVYGPAEVNQCSFFHVPPLPNRYADSYVPIGRPWAIAGALVLDESGQEVPPGQPGELLIAAPTRMRGYWNRPDLTEKGFFRQRPFPDSPYEKIYYRTGDMVQEDEDGELLFLGRRDRQVKIRGFRVELDEIEAALTAYEGVAEAAVYLVSRPGEEGEARLEAAVIPQANDQGSDPEAQRAMLIAHLGQRLPTYAQPGRLIFKSSFPRTGSGKLDRRALQEMATTASEQGPTL